MSLLQLDPLSLDDKNDPIGSYKIKLKPADYDVKVTVTEGYEVSADGGETYSREIVMKPNPGQRPLRIEKTLLVRKSDPFIGPGSIRHTQLGSQEEDTILPIGAFQSAEGASKAGVPPPFPLPPGPLPPGPNPPAPKPSDPGKKDGPEYLRPEKTGGHRWLLILPAIIFIALLIFYFMRRAVPNPPVPSMDSTRTDIGKADTAKQPPKIAPVPKSDSTMTPADSAKKGSANATNPNAGNAKKNHKRRDGKNNGNGKSPGDNDGPTNEINHKYP